MKKLKEDKRKLELEILKLINKFEEENDIYLYKINLIHDMYRNINSDKVIRTANIVTEIKI